jgi:outer membrane protein assembly factor BamB
MFFRQSYDGVYAFDWDTGKIVWHYEAPALAAFETGYYNNGTAEYSFNGGAQVADGKMYVYNTEHTETWPLTRGWGLHCINITTGERIWMIANPMNQGAMADGYLTASNSRDGYMYVYGKGKSATTVTAPDVAVPLGTALTIKGSVLDQSPAQADTPCVSKESMALQMEYLHLQQSISGLWGNETVTGVPVTLSAVGSDGTYYDIGTTTTNGYYGTFSMAWTPSKQDTYTIMANFAGDDSYGSSGAATAVTVGAPPAEPEPVDLPVQIDNTNLLNGILVAVVVAIVLAIVAILAIFRKRA